MLRRAFLPGRTGAIPRSQQKAGVALQCLVRHAPEAPLPADARLSIHKRMILGLGKLRRFYLVHLRPEYVRRSLARRVGNCNRTGACCRLMFTCPLLDERTVPVLCSIHESKPAVCRIFPIDERDLRDRDLVMPGKSCGFSFIPETQTGATVGPRREDHSVIADRTAGRRL